MYSKRYILENIEEFNEHNPIYDDIEGSICYPAYLNVGGTGRFAKGIMNDCKVYNYALSDE